MVSLGRLMDWTALVHLGKAQWWTHKATMMDPQCVSSSRGQVSQRWHGWISAGLISSGMDILRVSQNQFSLSWFWKWFFLRLKTSFWPVVEDMQNGAGGRYNPSPDSKCAPWPFFCIPWPLLDGLHPAQEVTFYHEESPSQYFSANWDGVQPDK